MILHLLAESSVRAAALAGAVGLLLWAFRIRDVSTRLAAWTVVIAGSLLMPVFTALLPGTEVPIPKWVVEKPQPVRNAVVLLTRAPGEPSAVALPLREQTAPPERRPVDWAALAAGLWAAVAAAMLVQLAIGVWCGRRLLRSAYRLDLPAPARVFESASVRVPITLGSFRPAIVLPPSWQVWDARKLEAVLAHESAHVVRRDPLRQLTASVYRAVFWFHPLAWWLHKEIAELAEAASDDAALAATRDETLYAEILLHFFATAPRRVQWDAVAMATQGKATKRMERILDTGRKLSHGLTRGTLAVLVLAAIPAVYLASSATPVWALVADQDPPEAPPAPVAPDATPVLAPAPPAPPAAPAIRGVIGGVIRGVPGGIPGPAIAPLPPTPPLIASMQNAPRPPRPARPPRPPRMNWDGDSFAIISDDHTNMNGSFGPGDAERLKRIRKQAGTDILWFRRGSGEYIIKDPALVAQAKQAIQSLEDEGKKMGEKGEMQGEYARKMAEEMERQMKPKQAEMERVGREMEKVGEEMSRSIQNDAQMKRLEQKMKELEKEMDAKGKAFEDFNQKFDERNSELDKLQDELGKEMEVLGQEMERKGEEMQQQMKSLLDEAIRAKKAEKII